MKTKSMGNPGIAKETEYRLQADSESYCSTMYEAKDDHVIIFAGRNGTLAIHKDNVYGFMHELKEFTDVFYGGRL